MVIRFQLQTSQSPIRLPCLTRRYGLRLISAPIAIELRLTFRAPAVGRVDLRKHEQPQLSCSSMGCRTTAANLPLRIRARTLYCQPELVHLPEGLVDASGPPP